MQITRTDVKDFVTDVVGRCLDAHLLSTATAIAAFALSYRSPDALTQVVQPHRWIQIAKWASAAGLASLTAALTLDIAGIQQSKNPVRLLPNISEHTPKPIQEAFKWVFMAGCACQVVAIGFFAASFAPHIENKSMCRFAAAALTTCFNTSLAAATTLVE